MRLHRRLSVFLLTNTFAATAPLYAQVAHRSVEGLWGFEQVLGPDVRGELLLSRERDSWRLRVAGYEVQARQEADTVRLSLPGERGTLRVRVGKPSDVAPHAMWVQPAGSSVPYASPVQLTRAGNNTWRGTVSPLEERFSLYLDIRPDSSGGLAARFRNPEGNFGGGRLFRAVVEPGQVGLVDAVSGKRRFTQPYDSASRTIAFDFGAPLIARPRTLADAPGFVPRTPGMDSYHYRPPVDLADGWRSARASAVGMLEDSLAALVRLVVNTSPIDDTAPRIHSILVARHGQLVLDEYFYGYASDRLHDLRSASKTMTSIMLGVAMHRRRAISTETKVTPAGATIGQLLTHTSGLACDDDDGDSPGNEDVMQGQSAEPDWYRYALKLPQLHPPGSAYAYCSAGINLVGRAIHEADGRWLPEFFDKELARPLGIRRYAMNLMPTGEGYAAGGMHLRPRDFLKFGQLYLNGGSWNGRPLVDRAWVSRSTQRQQPVSSGADDGFAWHRHVLQVNGREVPAFEASGNGGQYLVVIPSLGMTVVVTAGNYGQGRIWLRIRQELIARYIAGSAR